MCFMILCSVRPLLWMLVLLVIAVFMFSVAIAKGVASYVQDAEADFVELEAFASLPDVMMTLVKAAFGGEDWGAYVPALYEVGALYIILYLIFLGFMPPATHL